MISYFLIYGRIARLFIEEEVLDKITLLNRIVINIQTFII